jgi:hypothetical protein
MNFNELDLDPQEGTGGTPIVDDKQAKAKADLSEQVEKLDEPHNEEVKEQEKFDKSKDWSYYKEQGMTRKEWNRAQMSTGVDAEMKGFAEDPRAAAEYALAAPTGVLDAAIGTYNMVTPGPDFDKPVREYENQGAQFVRNMSSILLPGMGWAKGLKAVGTGAKAMSGGKVAAFLKDPFIAWSGNAMANLGAGAMADAAAPIQSITKEDGGQTLLGSGKEAFPTWMGWVPDDLVILDGDSPEAARAKNVTEGTIFGAAGGFVEGMGELARGLKGIKNFTEYVPLNENAGKYFSKNKPQVAQSVEEAVNAPVARMNAERAELGELNTDYALRDGVDPETNPIFGKDDALFDPGENAIRSSDDMGIVGAAVDQTRISKNIDTQYGRVRNPMSEAALKFSLDDTGAVPRIISQLGDSLRAAGEFDYRTTSGKLVKNATIKEAQDNLAGELLGMDKPQMQKLLSAFTVTKGGLPQLNAIGSKAVTNAINKSLKQLGELANMDNIRAMALTETAFAGQVADFAQGVRLQEGSVGAFRTMEQMFDRIEFLQDIRGISAVSKDTLERSRSVWDRFTGNSALKGDEKYAKEIADQMTGQTDSVLESLELIQADTHQFMQSLRQLSAERPNFLKPLASIYEMTDGDARSVANANNYLRNKFGVVKKAFVDGQPEIPSAIMNGFWSQMFNSALSGIKTPIKAGVGNLSTWVFKPASQVIGAYMNGDTRGLNRAFYAYGNTMETMTNGSRYMKNRWKASANDPTAMTVRDEIRYTKSTEDMELARQTAEAASAEGNDGPAMLYEIMKNQDDLAKHPWLRVGNRAMGAQDEWLKSINGQQIARMRAWDKVTEGGNRALVKADADKLAHEIYEQMFEDGVIKDPQVLAETARQAFSQDNVLSTGFRDIMKRIPALRPMFMFTKTPVNMAVFDIQMNPVQAFTNKLKRFDLPFEQQSVDKVKRLLQEEGVDLNTVDIAQEYTRKRNEYKGNHALGVSFVMMGVYGYLSGNITGTNGLKDPKKQKFRRSADWKPSTAFGFDYSQIPGLSTWLGLTVDMLDNFNELESHDLSQLLGTQAMILGNAFTDRLMLNNAEQLTDLVSGKGIDRWASNIAFTSQFKVAGAIGTMNQLIAPQLKAVEQRFDQLILNRTPGKQGLPDEHDWIDGGVVNEMGNPLHRLYNSLSPFPYHEKPSDVKEYLMDVEFDTVPGASTSTEGTEYTKAEQSEMNRIMGQQKVFQKGMKVIMKQHPVSDVKNSFDNRKQENKNPSISDVDNVHNKIDKLMTRAKAKAEMQMVKEREAKRKEAATRGKERADTRRGNTESAQQLIDSVPIK